MDSFTSAVDAALASKNWYAALALTLVLPDICGRLENPDLGSGERYAGWFQIWVEPAYTAHVGAANKKHVFLSGADCYALRCSLLHQGEVDISQQRAREALDNFHFLAPRDGSFIHCNQRGGQLILQVDQFCRDVCTGVEKWSESVAQVDEVQNRLKQLLTIEVLPQDGPLNFRI
ncbi:hypothetical protein [Sulfitobacter sp. M13]